jgi:invasion protein IalB
MRTTRIFAAAGAAVAVLTMAVPMGAAMAKETSAHSDQQRYSVVKKPDGRVLYCTKIETTGSRVPQKICNTAKEWRAQGVMIDTGHAA